jgi:hypothetical protein
MKLGFRIASAIVMACSVNTSPADEFTVVSNGEPRGVIRVDAQNTTAAGRESLLQSARWLAEGVKQASGAELMIEEGEASGDTPAVVLARADAQPDAAREAGFRSETFEAYAVVARPKRLYLLGRSEAAVGYAVADVLRGWGFRYYAPSPRWHIVPHATDLVVRGTRLDEPALLTRKIWYAYGHAGGDLKRLMDDHRRWSIANRLSDVNLTQTGHSYGNIILRNPKEFAEHPEYYALLADGKRDSERAVVARKFCTSNPGLLELVAADRLRLLEEQKRANPAAYMVSVDPSDGEGTCHCPECAKLGTTTDRVLHLANHVARKLRNKHPEAWVGLYAYSSHRLPPTIAVEPNVYVQVAMGFNRTQYTLAELVELWSKKVGAVGLREYYGVEAWDWGLPGRMRGSRVDYHRRWIPYFAERNVNAVNAETNSNWGGQTLGHYVAAQLMWNPQANVDTMVDEFFRLSFGEAAPTMRRLYAQFDAAPALRSATLRPMFDELEAAWSQTSDEAVRRRLADLMAYLVYASKYRDFELVQSRQASRNDEYYAALRPLMEYAWRIRERDCVHYYALARRLCNGLPVQDKRLDFYLANRETKPVWMTGEPYSDEEIRKLFADVRRRLAEDKDPTVTFSRYLDRVAPPGDDAGPSRILGMDEMSVARFRKNLRGYLQTSAKQTVRLGVAATGRSAVVTVYVREDEVLHRQEVRPSPSPEAAAGASAKPDAYRFDDVAFELPKAGEYRVEIEGDCVLRVPQDVALVYEASPTRPAWIDYSGPHYFYVPRGTKELYVDAEPRVGLVAPGAKAKIEIGPADRVAQQSYAVVPVPEGADGRVWHTTPDTRGTVMFLNIPPLLSLHRGTILVPREAVDPSDANSRAADPNER